MVSFDDFKKLDLRIALVESVTPHPNADRLYVLGIKVGDEQKTLVAGIRNAYEEKDLVGKKIVIINNLEPAVIRGVESQGMILAAQDGETLSVVVLDRDLADGAVLK